jgi:folate-binding protein YgfZ
MPLASAFADRSERAKLRVDGPQRSWFLHQVLSQSFEDIAPGDARDAAMLTPHGRMVAYLEVLATDDSLLAHCEPELRASLPEALARYVFATQVSMSDVTDEMGLVLVVGPGWEGAARAARALIHPTRSLGVEAAYLWVPAGGRRELLEALQRDGLRPASEHELESVRVAHGAPRWGRDMTPSNLPQEVGEDSFAVHYDKGCYLGQEAMAKIHFRGRVNRRLRRLAVRGELHADDELLLDDERVGRVTSVADGRALALLRRTVQSGAVLRAGRAEATVLD